MKHGIDFRKHVSMENVIDTVLVLSLEISGASIFSYQGDHGTKGGCTTEDLILLKEGRECCINSQR